MDRQETEALLKQFNIRPIHSLGQNFLIDPTVSARIVAAAELTKDEQVIEIGSGLGALTRLLVEQAGRTSAIEIDRHLIPALSHVLAGWPGCQILHQDVRHVALDSLAEDWPGQTVVTGNLPYYLTTPLIEQVLCELPRSRRIIFMMQKEAADRLMTAPGSRVYGPTAILLALHGPVRRLFRVSPNAFWPRPHIDSIVLVVDQHKDTSGLLGKDALSAKFAADPAIRRRFLRFLGHCFSRRRKQLKNNLSLPRHISAESLYTQIGLPTEIRPEQVEPAQYFALFARLYQGCPSVYRIDAQ